MSPTLFSYILCLKSPQDVPWSEQEATQIAGRGYRIGQTKPFQIFQIIALDTVDEELLALSQTKGALMELFTTPDHEEMEGCDPNDVWLPDAPILPPSPVKKKKQKANDIENPRNNHDMAEASSERRKMALMQYIAAAKAASSNPNLEQTTRASISNTVPRRVETFSDLESSGIVRRGSIEGEPSPIMHIGSLLSPVPIETHQGNDLDLPGKPDELNEDTNDEMPVTHNTSDIGGDGLQNILPFRAHGSLGDQIDPTGAGDIQSSTPPLAGVHRRKFRRPVPSGSMIDDKEDDLFRIPTIREFYGRTRPETSSTSPSSQRPRACRTERQQSATPSSVSASDDEFVPEDRTNSDGSREAVTSPSHGVLLKKRSNRKYDLSKSRRPNSMVAISSKNSIQKSKKRRQSDERSSFELEPKRQQREASPQHQKRKAVAYNPLLNSAEKISRRESAVDDLF